MIGIALIVVGVAMWEPLMSLRHFYFIASSP